MSMSLLGLVSRWPVLVRTTPSGDAWGFVVQEPSNRWTISAEGSGGALAVSRGPCDWTVYANDPSAAVDASSVTGELIIAVTSPDRKKIPRMRSASWFFVYEGTIADVDALLAIIQPT